MGKSHRGADVCQVRLDHFRNYDGLDLDLSAGFNLFVGSNGQGKTNLLEAFYLIATSRLLRGQKDVEAIKEGSHRARVEMEIGEGRTVLSVSLERGVRKRSFLNGVGLPKASDLLGRLHCVCVSSIDMEIVRGEPAERRLFLDLELSGRSAGYLRNLAIYKKALEERNALVRAARESFPSAALWETYEDQMAHAGAMLRSDRFRLIQELSEPVGAIHRQMGGGEELRLSYLPKDKAESGEDLRSSFEQSRQSDVQRGSTSLGPHRDDLAFSVNGLDARNFGSQGQQRTAVIALKLGTLRAASDALGETPLLLLDDIFSDLDPLRRSRLVEIVLEQAQQTILTCTDLETAGVQIRQRATLYNVSAGQVQML